jgi:hypothetical protein
MPTGGDQALLRSGPVSGLRGTTTAGPLRL